MAPRPQSHDRIAELLVHVGRAARSEDGSSKLTAAQWTCLRFFARANGNTRTPSSFADFQATTRGTASQIIKSLEQLGLIERRPSERDRRSVRFDLTAEGHRFLAHDPLRDLMGVIRGLAPPDRDRFLDTLSQIASNLAHLREAPAFGTCEDCKHFAGGKEAGYCACISAELSSEDIDKLCASYRPLSKTPRRQGEPDGRA